jgi:hypothetical protein
MESLVKYPRFTLFIQKDSYDNSEWIRNLIPNRILNIGTFRSSFVSCYYPKVNNLEKKLMVIRMRTSLEELNRAYLKFYNNPDTLVTVKAEPTVDLIDRVSRGQLKHPIIINNQIKKKEEPIEVDEGYIPIQQQPILNKMVLDPAARLPSAIRAMVLDPAALLPSAILAMVLDQIRNLQLGTIAEKALVQFTANNANANTTYCIRCNNCYSDGFDSYNVTSAVLYLGNGLKSPETPTYHKLISDNLNYITLVTTDDVTSNSGIYGGIDPNIQLV